MSSAQTSRSHRRFDMSLWLHRKIRSPTRPAPVHDAWPSATTIVPQNVVLPCPTVLSCATASSHAQPPIERLPSEILAYIFALRAESDVDDMDSGDPRPSSPRLAWIVVTHVCRRWRLVALECPHVWAHIILALGEHWVELMLERAKTVAVSVYGRHCPALSARLCALIVCHLPHTKRISLTAHDRNTISLIRLLTGPAPVLERFELSICHRLHEHPKLPTKFLGNDAPKLRHLAVSNLAGIPWTSATLANLTSLVLDNQERQTACAQFLDALVKMQALVHLTLAGGLPSAGHSSNKAARRKAVLLRLASLTLTRDPSGCAHVLQHLVFPSTARVDISIDMISSPEVVNGLKNDLLPVLAMERFLHDGTIRVLPIRKLAVLSYPNIPEGVFATGTRGSCDTVGSFTLSLIPKTPKPPGESDFNIAMACLILSTSAEHLQDLVVDVPYDRWNQYLWVSFVWRMPGLRRIRVRGDLAGAAFCAMLARPFPKVRSQAEAADFGPDSTGPRCYYLPNLAYLCLVGVDFASYRIPLDVPKSEEYSLFKAFSDGLVRRVADVNLKPLRVLEFVDCATSDVHLPDLARAAGCNIGVYTDEGVVLKRLSA